MPSNLPPADSVLPGGSPERPTRPHPSDPPAGAGPFPGPGVEGIPLPAAGPPLPGRADLPGHRVENQPLPRDPAPLWASDPVLRQSLAGGQAATEGGDDALAAVMAYARALEAPGRREAGRAANRHGPELRSFDAGGRRLDEVAFHPAYHDFLRLGIEGGYAALPWGEARDPPPPVAAAPQAPAPDAEMPQARVGGPGRAEPGAPGRAESAGIGGHVAHAAMVYLHSQVEPGTCCPLTMTYAALAVPGLPAHWRRGLLSRRYDPAIQPAGAKAGLTLGMALTEKQGGSDLRQTATRARRAADGWRLTGHKWFCSAPMSDGFLTLAQGPEGLTCFLVPRWLEDERNGIRIVRLKDKLGNRSNASAEIEYEDALAIPLGDPGEGIRTVLPMVHHTRLDTAMAPAGLMRAALAEAWHWCRQRQAFQRRLSDQPLMRSLIADLALDWEASLVLGLRVARAFDAAAPCDRAFSRIGVALAKFHNTELCVPVVTEAMEAMGGMGYVEDTGLPLLYREAPLNAIWEGSGNVICLDALRTLARDPLAAEALRVELGQARGADRRFDAALHEHEMAWPGLPEEGAARWYVERLAVMLAGALLIREAPAAVADAYVATRVLGERGRLAGSTAGLDTAALLARLGE